MFLLGWGILATLIGWGLITNFRGFADKYVSGSYTSTGRSRFAPSWRSSPRRLNQQEPASRMNRTRLIAVPFAILGPILTIIGAVQVAQGHIGVPRGPALPLPVALVFIVAGALIVAQYWLRGRPYRVAAQQGGWTRALAILASLGGLSFGVFTALGQTTLGIVGCLVSGVATVLLIVSRKTDPPTSSDSTGPEAASPTPSDSMRPSPTNEQDDDDAAFRWL